MFFSSEVLSFGSFVSQVFECVLSVPPGCVNSVSATLSFYPPRSRGLWQAAAPKLSPDWRLPCLFLCRVTLLLWERSGEGWSRNMSIFMRVVFCVDVWLDLSLMTIWWSLKVKCVHLASPQSESHIQTAVNTDITSPLISGWLSLCLCVLSVNTELCVCLKWSHVMLREGEGLSPFNISQRCFFFFPRVCTVYDILPSSYHVHFSLSVLSPQCTRSPLLSCSGSQKSRTTVPGLRSCWLVPRWTWGTTATPWRNWLRTSSAPYRPRAGTSWRETCGPSNSWSALPSPR